MILQLVVNIILSSAIYLLIATSFTIIYYPSKFFHIFHGIIIVSGAYFVYFIYKILEISIIATIPLSICCSIFLCLLIEICVYKPLRNKKTSPLKMLITSLGLYVVFQNLISIFFGDDTKSFRNGDIKAGNEFLGAYITNIQITIIVICFLLFIFTVLFFKYAKIGRNIRAIASNVELSNIVGIVSDKIFIFSIAIGSGMASVAGILVASDTGMTPTMGFKLLLYGVVAMIIGGIGSTWGLLGGSLLLAIVQQLTSFFLDNKWMDSVTYLILIIFLIWKPLGFSGNRLKKIEI
jgi:branched-chain amino acid transport system permease protein